MPYWYFKNRISIHHPRHKQMYTLERSRVLHRTHTQTTTCYGQITAAKHANSKNPAWQQDSNHHLWGTVWDATLPYIGILKMHVMTCVSYLFFIVVLSRISNYLLVLHEVLFVCTEFSICPYSHYQIHLQGWKFESCRTLRVRVWVIVFPPTVPHTCT